MSSQYCFDIVNPKKVDIDIDMLKKFVNNLYTGKGKFSKTEKKPFITIHAKSDNSICIVMTSRGKKNIEKIEEINRKLKNQNLKVTKDISLKKPYEFMVETAAWWGGDKPGNGKRWSSLIHRGPYFTHLMEPYKYLGASLIYDGKKYKLSPKEEKIALFYGRRIISEESGNVVDAWTKDKIFNKNFWTGFRTYLSPEHRKIFKDFSKIGWGDVVAKIEAEKEKGLSETEKTLKKILTEEKKREYGYAFLDGVREKVGNFTIEPQAIFYGRGENPNRGRIKAEINPEDVTINVGVDDPIPAPPPGHQWGNITHDRNSVWLARWTDSITNDIKYVMFSAEGRFKGESDLGKYEKARKLQKHIDTIRKQYEDDAKSAKSTKMQLGTVLYLIDHFGVRVGNEKKKEEADTVGASTLRVDHIRLNPPNHVIFDFLGKDSIRFYKDLEVPDFIYSNFSKLIKGKSKTAQVFNAISASDINEYLKQFDADFSAKVFRTRLASKIMFEALKEVEIPPNSTKQKIKTLFNKANVKVADVLNHTRNISKKAKESVEKLNIKLSELKKEKKQKQKEGKSLVQINKRIESAKNSIESKKDVMSVAISTSLTNYIDPRIIVSWSKEQEIDISAIYTSTLMKKFKWAIEMTEQNWNWMKSPLLGNPDLDPADENKSKSRKKSPVKKSPIRRHKKFVRREDDTDRTQYPSAKIREEKIYTKIKKSSPKKSSVFGPGTIDDYKIINLICEDPKKNIGLISNISKEALLWIYNFSKYIGNKGNLANEYIVKFSEAAYLRY